MRSDESFGSLSRFAVHWRTARSRFEEMPSERASCSTSCPSEETKRKAQRFTHLSEALERGTEERERGRGNSQLTHDPGAHRVHQVSEPLTGVLTESMDQSTEITEKSGIHRVQGGILREEDVSEPSILPESQEATEERTPIDHDRLIPSLCIGLELLHTLFKPRSGSAITGLGCLGFLQLLLQGLHSLLELLTALEKCDFPRLLFPQDLIAEGQGERKSKGQDERPTPRQQDMTGGTSFLLSSSVLSQVALTLEPEQQNGKLQDLNLAC